MPELPEVETIVRRLRRVLPGRTVAGVEIARENVVRGPVRRFLDALEGSTIAAVERRAKFILIRLRDGRIWTTHLRMSGKYRVAPRGAGGRVAGGAPRERYVRASFQLDDGTRLLYVDPRALGEMEVLDPAGWAEKEASLGPEPLDPGFSPELLRRRLGDSRRSVKQVLLDQGRIAGLGNIYACEALWRARISPRRRAANVGPGRAVRLHRGIVSVLEAALEGGGTSLGATYLDYVDAEGEPGAFSERLDVYGREGEACSRCGTPIRRIVQGQRSTWYCPRCQR